MSSMRLIKTLAVGLGACLLIALLMTMGFRTPVVFAQPKPGGTTAASATPAASGTAAAGKPAGTAKPGASGTAREG